MCFFLLHLENSLLQFVTRCREFIRGMDSSSATARLSSRYRGCTRYRGVRYREFPGLPRKW